MQVYRERDAIRSRGAELHFVGNGNRHFAQAFREQFVPGASLFVDTGREAYRALGMKRSVVATLASLATWKRGLRALRSGFRQGTVQGDAFQLGGVLVVLPGGRIAYRYVSESAGDHPPVEKALEAVPGKRTP